MVIVHAPTADVVRDDERCRTTFKSTISAARKLARGRNSPVREWIVSQSHQRGPNCSSYPLRWVGVSSLDACVALDVRSCPSHPSSSRSITTRPRQSLLSLLLPSRSSWASVCCVHCQSIVSDTPSSQQDDPENEREEREYRGDSSAARSKFCCREQRAVVGIVVRKQVSGDSHIQHDLHLGRVSYSSHQVLHSRGRPAPFASQNVRIW